MLGSELGSRIPIFRGADLEKLHAGSAFLWAARRLRDCESTWSESVQSCEQKGVARVRRRAEEEERQSGDATSTRQYRRSFR